MIEIKYMANNNKEKNTKSMCNNQWLVEQQYNMCKVWRRETQRCQNRETNVFIFLCLVLFHKKKCLGHCFEAIQIRS